MDYAKSRWQGNQWVSIEIEPVDEAYFLPMLTYLMATYDFPQPHIIDGIDGYIANFHLSGCETILSVDTWSFSILFADEAVRDTVLGALLALPDDFFIS